MVFSYNALDCLYNIIITGTHSGYFLWVQLEMYNIRTHIPFLKINSVIISYWPFKV